MNGPDVSKPEKTEYCSSKYKKMMSFNQNIHVPFLVAVQKYLCSQCKEYGMIEIPRID